MATVRMIVRENRLARKPKSQKREELKATIKDRASSPEEVIQAVFALQKRPVDESEVRRRRRCVQCGRPRGVYRKFGLCRCCLRLAFHRMELPGMKKSSW